MIRQPAVAGQFYSSNPSQLRKEIQKFMGPEATREKAIGIIAPHAGYMYSGAVAGALYNAVEIPDTVLILGPNHHGFGSKAAIYPSGEWLTPLGSSKINDRLSNLVKSNSKMFEEDMAAHHYEHSLEVQLPFLQYINRDVTIVPICIGYSDYAACKELGIGIAKAIREFGDDVLLLASSDMTHYESALSAKKKDELALREVLELNAEGLLNICRKESITMCGVIPVAIMIVAALELGATRAEIVRYSTSGDVTGDNEHVVAYAAVAIT
jgi:AmmeMemoRadiSam system protein B